MEATGSKPYPEATDCSGANNRTCKCAAGITHQKRRSMDVAGTNDQRYTQHQGGCRPPYCQPPPIYGKSIDPNAETTRFQPDPIDYPWWPKNSQPIPSQRTTTQFQPDPIDPNPWRQSSKPIQNRATTTQFQPDPIDPNPWRQSSKPIQNRATTTQFQPDPIDPNPWRQPSQSVENRRMNDQRNVEFMQQPLPTTDACAYPTRMDDQSEYGNDNDKCAANGKCCNQRECGPAEYP